MKFITPLILASALFVGCQQQKTNQETNVTADTTKCTQQLRLAYVVIDSLNTQYEYCKEQETILNQKQTALRNKLMAQSNQLQQTAAEYQKKAQEGKFTSQAEVEKVEKQLQQMQQNLAAQQAKAEQEITTMALNYRQDLQKRLNEYLKDYNKDGKYDMILTNSMSNVNILYAKPSMDITMQVIEGMNKAYKKEKK